MAGVTIYKQRRNIKIMKLWFLFPLVLFFCIFSSQAEADIESVDYLAIIEDNGNVIVTVNIEGEGVVNLPIQKDAEEINVEGGLYIIEEDEIEVSIGETGEAFVLYSTSMLTKKNGRNWEFDMKLPQKYSVGCAVAMPKDTNLEETIPNAVIESGEIMKLHWNNETDEIYVKYYFDKEIIEEEIKGANIVIYLAVIFCAILALSGGVIIFSKRREIKKLDKKKNIIKTLPPNETKIVELLMENDGEMKRSIAERKLEIAKSSLAVSLKNLERKNIIKVDRTSASHYLRFTSWFNEL